MMPRRIRPIAVRAAAMALLLSVAACSPRSTLGTFAQFGLEARKTAERAMVEAYRLQAQGKLSAAQIKQAEDAYESLAFKILPAYADLLAALNQAAVVPAESAEARARILNTQLAITEALFNLLKVVKEKPNGSGT